MRCNGTDGTKMGFFPPAAEFSASIEGEVRGQDVTLQGMTYGEMEVWLHSFLVSAVYAGDWSLSGSCRFTPGEGFPYVVYSRQIG
jgi:hypothetical protein